MRAFHGARQGTASASANRAPGFDPASPATIAKKPATQGPEAKFAPGFDVMSPQYAAASMHNSLADDAKQLANGSSNVPLHQWQVPSEGADTQETEGDGSVRDPSGQGFGT